MKELLGSVIVVNSMFLKLITTSHRVWHHLHLTTTEWPFFRVTIPGEMTVRSFRLIEKGIYVNLNVPGVFKQLGSNLRSFFSHTESLQFISSKRIWTTEEAIHLQSLTSLESLTLSGNWRFVHPLENGSDGWRLPNLTSLEIDLTQDRHRTKCGGFYYDITSSLNVFVPFIFPQLRTLTLNGGSGICYPGSLTLSFPCLEHFSWINIKGRELFQFWLPAFGPRLLTLSLGFSHNEIPASADLQFPAKIWPKLHTLQLQGQSMSQDSKRWANFLKEKLPAINHLITDDLLCPLLFLTRLPQYLTILLKGKGNLHLTSLASAWDRCSRFEKLDDSVPYITRNGSYLIPPPEWEWSSLNSKECGTKKFLHYPNTGLSLGGRMRHCDLTRRCHIEGVWLQFINSNNNLQDHTTYSLHHFPLFDIPALEAWSDACLSCPLHSCLCQK